MADKNNATCSICGNSYHVCLSCKDSIDLAPWKRYTDTSEHYKIYQIMRGYNTKMYTKEETRVKLKNVDLSDMNTFREHIRVKIEDILKEEPVMEFVEEINSTTAKEETPVVASTNVSRKKKHKVEIE